MKCLYYGSYNSLEVKEVPIPAMADDEVLVKVAGCGICGSEIETYKSRSPRRTPPLIMGHEFSGEIVQVGSNVTGYAVGQQVISHSMVSCGRCFYCLRGDTHLCENRQIFGMHRAGAFAEFVNVPARALIATDQSVNPLAACLSEPLANGIHIVNLTRHLSPARIVIIGAGSIGLMVLQAFKVLTNCEVVITDLDANRLRVGITLGADHAIDVSEERFHERIHHIFPQGADLVIDAVGAGVTNQQGMFALRGGGAMVMIGLFENSNAISSYEIILREKQVIGTYAAKMQELAQALALIEQKKVDVTSWVDYQTLNHSAEAFLSMVNDPVAVKMVITNAG